MEIKAVVNESLNEPKRGDLMISNSSTYLEERIIIMFYEKTGDGNFSGTVIANPKAHRPIGHYRTDWITECFSLFHGTITLEQ